jgi:hypothetical protein
MSQSMDDGAGEAALASFLMLIAGLLLFGIFLLARWLTALLLERVISPALDGAMERHDGLAVVLSAGLWGLLAGLLSPLTIPAERWSSQPELALQSVAIQVGLGVAWGLAVGAGILLTWWLQVEEPGYDVMGQAPALPVELVLSNPPAANGHGELAPQELEKLIQGDRLGQPR